VRGVPCGDAPQRPVGVLKFPTVRAAPSHAPITVILRGARFEASHSTTARGGITKELGCVSRRGREGQPVHIRLELQATARLLGNDPEVESQLFHSSRWLAEQGVLFGRAEKPGRVPCRSLHSDHGEGHMRGPAEHPRRRNFEPESSSGCYENRGCVLRPDRPFG